MPDKHYLVKKQLKDEKILCPVIENFHDKFPYPELYGYYINFFAPSRSVLDQPTQIIRGVESQQP